MLCYHSNRFVLFCFVFLRKIIGLLHVQWLFSTPECPRFTFVYVWSSYLWLQIEILRVHWKVWSLTLSSWFASGHLACFHFSSVPLTLPLLEKKLFVFPSGLFTKLSVQISVKHLGLWVCRCFLLLHCFINRLPQHLVMVLKVQTIQT